APPPGLPSLLRARPQQPGRLPSRPGPQLPARLRRPRGHRRHPQLRGQRKRARGALVRLRSQRKPARGVRNRAIQAFDGGWPSVLHNQLDPHQDPEHSLLQV
ncbi:hypothetical protein E2I00_008967, partial [Balaenoptera physalus]